MTGRQKLKLIVFGPTGGTGRELVRQALEAGHEASVFARGPLDDWTSKKALHVIRGDVFDGKAVAAAVKAQDVVVSSLGTRPWRHTDVCSVGTRNILSAMKQHGVNRLVVVSALGVGPTRHTLAWFLRPAYLIIRRALDDKEVMEEEIPKSDREWVIVQPPILTNGPLTGKYRVVVDGSIRSGFISRADVAHFILNECLTGDRYLRQTPSLAY